MSVKGKLSRKELNAPDEFMHASSKVLEWLVSHKMMIIGALTALVVAIGALWAWRHFSKRVDLAAGDALAEALEVMQRPVKGDFMLEVSEDNKPFDTAKDRAKAALEKLEALVKNHSSSKVAKIAPLHIGNQQLILGDADKAIAAYETFLRNKPASEHLAALAVENLGFAYEQKKDLGKALEQFEKLAAGKVFAERGHYHKGRIHLAQGDKVKAKEAYQKAIDKAKELKVDWFAQDVEARMNLLDLP